MDKKELNEYNALLKKIKIWSEEENKKMEIEKRRHFKLGGRILKTTYDEKLVITGCQFRHYKYDSPVVTGFTRNEKSVENGAKKRVESLEKRKELNKELEEYVKLFPQASKKDKKAMAYLKKIKEKYKDEFQIRDDNKRRSINKFKDRIQSNFNIFTHFITLSFEENLVGIAGIAKGRELFKEWTKKMKAIDEKFVYCYVIEFQERGALHFHVLCSLFLGQKLPRPTFMKIRKTWEKIGSINIKGIKTKYSREVGKKFRESPENIGLREVDVTEQQIMIWSIGNYLTQYLTKGTDDIFLFGSKMYGSSRGLEDKIEIKDKKRIPHLLKYLGTEELKEKEIVVEHKIFDKDGNQVPTEDSITIKYYNKLIKK